MAHFLLFFKECLFKNQWNTLSQTDLNSELGMFSKVLERWKDIDRESRTKTELITISLLFENLQGECIILEEKQFLNKKDKLDVVRLFTLYYTTILYARKKKPLHN